jgi:DNA polymerase-1
MPGSRSIAGRSGVCRPISRGASRRSRRAIYRDVGSEFNIGSPKQLGEVLFDKLNLPGGKKGKTGAYGTDASILEQLQPLHPVPGQVLEWRQLTKLKSTYADALVDEIDPEDQRVHTTYALTVAATGRFSSTDPNLQNIPVRTEEGRKIRRAFVAEPGHLLLSADYSQIELRLAAHVADIPALKEAFLAGHDIHAATASEVFNVPLDQMDPQTRRRAKAINFGISTGSARLGSATRSACRSPRRRTISAPISSASRASAPTWSGSRPNAARRLCRDDLRPQMLHPRHPRRQPGAPHGRRAPGDQRAAAGLGRRHHQAGDGRMPAALQAAGLKARMLLQVHDELLFEAPEDEVQATASLVKEVMEGACAPRCELSVPLVVETGWATTWDAAH